MKSASENRFYMVRLNPSLQGCECQDYLHQYQALGKGHCKHLQAVVNYLGYSSLEASVLGAQAEAAKSIQPDRDWPTVKPHIAVSDIKPNGKYSHISII